MTLQRNHYEVLGVPRKATTDEIKKKYRELARKFHPDIAKDKAMGEKIFSQINQAYHVLGDPDRRAQYDASQAAEDSAPPAASRNGMGSSAGVSPPLSAQSIANFVRLLAEAETAMLQSNVGKVKSICDLILKSDPRNHKALALLGDALVQMGKPQDAASAYQQALQITPSATLQAKLNRLTGAPINGSSQNGNGAQTRPANGAAPRPTPPPTFNGNGQNGNGNAGQSRTDQGRATPGQAPAEKSGGLLSRLLGKKQNAG